MANRKPVWVAESTGHFKYGVITVGESEDEARAAALKRLRELYSDWEAYYNDDLNDYVNTFSIASGEAQTV